METEGACQDVGRDYRTRPSIPPITGPGSPQLLPHSGTPISDGGPLTPEGQRQLQRGASQRQRFEYDAIRSDVRPATC